MWLVHGLVTGWIYSIQLPKRLESKKIGTAYNWGACEIVREPNGNRTPVQSERKSPEPWYRTCTVSNALILVIALLFMSLPCLSVC